MQPQNVFIASHSLPLAPYVSKKRISRMRMDLTADNKRIKIYDSYGQSQQLVEDISLLEQPNEVPAPSISLDLPPSCAVSAPTRKTAGGVVADARRKFVVPAVPENAAPVEPTVRVVTNKVARGISESDAARATLQTQKRLASWKAHASSQSRKHAP
jgi:hypothetical protein